MNGEGVSLSGEGVSLYCIIMSGVDTMWYYIATGYGIICIEIAIGYDIEIAIGRESK